MLKFTLLLILTPWLLKGMYVDDFIYHYTATRGLGFGQVLVNDAVFYAALLCLLYVSLLPRVNRLFTVGLRIIAIILFVIYLADYIVIVNFNTHLTTGDTLKYAAYASKYIQQVYALNFFSMLLLCAVILFPIIWLALSKYKLGAQKDSKLPLYIFATLPLASGFSAQEKYAHAWIYKNVLDYNLTILSEASPYSTGFVKAFHYQEVSQCFEVMPVRKNVILLMVESLSSYQSQYFSGIQNWTPNLDIIASQHLAFKNFYANGFITEDGEIALLTGLPPIYPPSSYSDDGGTSFRSFFNIKDSLPNILRSYGYQSDFLTSADLEFGNTGAWAKSIGFDYVEGHDHPDYNSWERFHFQAAPDAALYLRALDKVEQHKQQPFFMFIKTVSSHHPYVNPENKHKSESEAIQYADRQIGQFYRQLQQQHFFQHGMLIIVGDHHSMTPLKKAEFDTFGQYKAAARVPLVIVDSQPAKLENQPFQQTDVFNSLQGLASGKTCYSDWKGILLGAKIISPKFIAHRRGDNRDLISVFAAGQEYIIKLDGDKSRVQRMQQLDSVLQQNLVNKINALRIARHAAS